MKKTFKLIALCLSLFALTVLFTGCDAIDEMKADHAILSGDGNKITFRGETYKKLPHGAELYTSDIYGEKFENIAVTDYDVPVLLANRLSYTNQYDEINDLFVLYSSDFEFYDTNYSAITYYCNQKDYQKYANAIENGVLDRIGFQYEIYDNDQDSFFYKLEVASENLSSEILDYINNPEKLTKDAYEEINSSNIEYLRFGMLKCDSEGIITESLDSYDIFMYNGKAYLVIYADEVAVRLSDETAAKLKDQYFYNQDTSFEIISSTDDEANLNVIFYD